MIPIHCRVSFDVHTTRMVTGAFATAGPRVWNSLPAELQQCSSLRQFKRCLKTFLFGSWDYGALCLFVKQRRIEIVLLTYLYASVLCAIKS